jgi:RNA polymerase sigma-70 factor (ECF subfamily)
MAECKEIFARLSEYLDADMPIEDCDQIQAHIAGCPPCVEFVESLKRSIGLCKECPPETAPTPLNPEVRARLLDAYRKMLDRR